MNQVAGICCEGRSIEINPGDKRLDFTGRLARENNWSYRLAERVIFEYKRFCILVMRSGHRVTLSEFVDRLASASAYTKSYGGRPEALGGALCHEPTKGGQAEGENWRLVFGNLRSYERILGKVP